LLEIHNTLGFANPNVCNAKSKKISLKWAWHSLSSWGMHFFWRWHVQYTCHDEQAKSKYAEHPPNWLVHYGYRCRILHRLELRSATWHRFDLRISSRFSHDCLSILACSSLAQYDISILFQTSAIWNELSYLLDSVWVFPCFLRCLEIGNLTCVKRPALLWIAGIGPLKKHKM
jgi:hypothetical protein